MNLVLTLGKSFKEKLKGGRAAGKKPSDYDPKAVAEGREHEHEHTDDSDVATEIAMDHLEEDPDYYRKLKKIEASKSLLTINPDRMKPHAHVAAVRGGRAVRAGRHAAPEVYSFAEWRHDTFDLLTEHALTHLDGEAANDPVSWLKDRGIRVPDAHDCLSPRTVGSWLQQYGPTAFALGIHLKDAQGRTIASPQELPRQAPALKALVSDLAKGRAVGAKGKHPYSTGKYGAFLVPGDAKYKGTGGLRKLTMKDMARRGAIAEEYARRGIPAQYLPPTQAGFVSEKDVEAAWAAHRAREKAQKLYADPKHAAPTPEGIKPKEATPVSPVVETTLHLGQFGGEAEHRIREVLLSRVADWEPRKTRTGAYDPRVKEEITALQQMLRDRAKEIVLPDGMKRSKKNFMRADQTYRDAQYRLSELRGSVRSTTEVPVPKGVKVQDATGKVDVQKLGTEKHLDLGFSPYAKPMSYLLSLGWHKREAETNPTTGVTRQVNAFTPNEWNAAWDEYENYINGVSYEAARYVLGPSELEKIKPAERKAHLDYIAEEVKSKANTFFVEKLKAYQPPKEGPSADFNFASYMHSALRKLARGTAIDTIKQLGKMGGFEVEPYAEELEDMAIGQHGSLRTPSVKPETPEQFYDRMELNTQVSKLFRKILNPIEWLVLKHRLNIEDVRGQPRQVSGGKLTPGIHSEEPVVFSEAERSGGLKSWEQTKDDVIADLPSIMPKKAAKELGGKLAKVNIRVKAQNQFEREFDTALKKLRGYFLYATHEAPEEIRLVNRWANTERLLLEGVRHRTWEPGRGLRVRAVDDVSPDEIAELEHKFKDLTEKVAAAKDARERDKFRKQRQRLSGKLIGARSDRQLAERIQRDKAANRKITGAWQVHDIEVQQFWDEGGKRGKLADQLRMNLDPYYQRTGVVTPRQFENDKVRAHVFKLLLEGLEEQYKTPQQRQEFMANVMAGQAKAPGLVGQYNVNIDRHTWLTIARYIAGEATLTGPKTYKNAAGEDVPVRSRLKAKKKAITPKEAAVEKSLVICDCAGALGLLIEEVSVWSLEGR